MHLSSSDTDYVWYVQMVVADAPVGAIWEVLLVAEIPRRDGLVLCSGGGSSGVPIVGLSDPAAGPLDPFAAWSISNGAMNPIDATSAVCPIAP